MKEDWQIQKLARLCAASGRELREGETIYSLLTSDQGHWKRLDFAAEHWPGPPEKHVAWWKSQAPVREQKAKLAPTEALVRFFEELAESEQRPDLLYVLSLLLQRRRVLRVDEVRDDDDGVQRTVVYCARSDRTWEVATAPLSPRRLSALQDELHGLLWGDPGAMMASIAPPAAPEPTLDLEPPTIDDAEPTLEAEDSEEAVSFDDVPLIDDSEFPVDDGSFFDSDEKSEDADESS